MESISLWRVSLNRKVNLTEPEKEKQTAERMKIRNDHKDGFERAGTYWDFEWRRISFVLSRLKENRILWSNDKDQQATMYWVQENNDR